MLRARGTDAGGLTLPSGKKLGGAENLSALPRNVEQFVQGLGKLSGEAIAAIKEIKTVAIANLIKHDDTDAVPRVCAPTANASQGAQVNTGRTC